MGSSIIPELSSRGGIDLNVAGLTVIELPADQALTLASRVLSLLGKTSITNRPDGTWIAR